jgi:fatty-acyl-CoA synthase/long-chain acyl-CoA synthetase
MGIDNTGDMRRILDHWVEHAPDDIALVDGTRRVSYRWLHEAVRSLSACLLNMGIGRDSPLFLVLPSTVEFIVWYLAGLELEAVLVPNDEKIKIEQLFERMDALQPAVVITNRADVASAVRGLPKSPRVVSVGFAAEGCISYGTMLEAIGTVSGERFLTDTDATFIVAFTSGSTGAPKGIELSYRNVYVSARAFGERLQATKDDVFLVPVPLSHMFGMNVGILLPLSLGARVILPGRFAEGGVLDTVAEERVTILYGVPTMFVREIEAQRNCPRDLSSIRTGLIGGASLTASLVVSIREVLHCNVMVGYASTEALAVAMTAFDDPPELVAASVGRPFDCVRVALADVEGRLVQAGKGEIVCQGDVVAKGPLDGTGAMVDQRSANAGGWLHTGDMGRIDDDGYLYILGRKDDMIIRGGYNIFPSEVTSFFAAHPDVADVCVVGLPSEEWGEQIGAAVILREGSVQTVEALREYAVAGLPKNKVPDRIVLVNDFPKLSTGKIDVEKIKALFG